MEPQDETMRYLFAPGERRTRDVLLAVYAALVEKGYDPVSQLVGYLLSGDPTYITSHRGARSLIRTIDRDELLEELVASYLELGAPQRRADRR